MMTEWTKLSILSLGLLMMCCQSEPDNRQNTWEYTDGDGASVEDWDRDGDGVPDSDWEGAGYGDADGDADGDVASDADSDSDADGSGDSEWDTEEGSDDRDPGSNRDGSALENPRIIAYYTAWSIYARNYNVADIPAGKLTHLNYAFANVSPGGEVVLGDPWADVEKSYTGDTWDQPVRGNFNQLVLLKQKHPHLKTLISVGGWTWSAKFSDVALTDASRKTFAQSAVKFVVKYQFDGVDIDWEYPVKGGLEGNIARPEDKQNYTLLMKELRSQLDAQGAVDGNRYLLTAAVSAGADKVSDMEVGKMMQHVDWVNIMTYDLHGGWDGTTNHHSALYASSGDPSSDSTIREKYNVHGAVQEYLAAGAPAHKLTVGVPFYGRAWKGVSSANGGLFQKSGGVPAGTWDDWASGDTGVNDYWDILQLEASTEYTRYWDNEAKAPYLYSVTAHGGHMISFEDSESLGYKLDYVSDNKLGGIMVWELAGDERTNPEKSLLRQIYEYFF